MNEEQSKTFKLKNNKMEDSGGLFQAEAPGPMYPNQGMSQLHAWDKINLIHLVLRHQAELYLQVLFSLLIVIVNTDNFW